MLVSELCTRSLKLCGILGQGDAAASAEDMNDAVATLNEMLTAWALEGMDVGHDITATQNDNLYVDDAYIKAVRYALAVELSAEFNTPVTPAVVQIAIFEKENVRAALADINLLACDEAITGGRAVFNSVTGQ